jgi:hypothetical protein
MDGLCVGPEEIRKIGAGVEEDTGAAVGHYKAEEVVEIDVKTNLDIFGQPIKAVDSAPTQHSVGEDERELAEPLFAPASPEASTSTVAVPIEAFPEPPPVVSRSSEASSSFADKAETEVAVENGSPSQSAARPSATETETETMKETPVTHVDEDQAISSEGQLSEISFAFQDSEGLSTIYEESSLSETQSSEEVDTVGLANGEAILNTGRESSALAALEINSDKPESLPESADNEEPAAETISETSCSPAASASHVANAADRLPPSDSPRRNNVPSSTNATQQPPLGTENESSPNISSKDAVPSCKDDEVDVAMPGHSETDENSQLCVKEPKEVRHDDIVEDNSAPELPNFTPINGGQTSSPHAPDSGLRDEEPGAEHDSDSDDADEVVEEEPLADEDHDATEAMDDDDMLPVNPPCPANDTLQLQAMHDDSETEMLRKFVTRVAADKNAKALAAAATDANNTLRPARRPGCLGLTTSTGSPMTSSEPETRTIRKPLAEKSSNSPSPTKNKRKLELIVEDTAKPKDGSRDQEDDLDDGPRIKRRRKRADPILDTATVGGGTAPSASPESESLPSDPAPRRSTRARRLKPAAPSANSIAFSMIPVRLPGMGAMDDAALETHYAAMARQRSEEKDLAAITRVNTRKNKGGAVPPQVVLAKQAEDPNWRMRELKGVVDAKERRQQQQEVVEGGDGADGEKKKNARKAAKGVRWAEELVRFHEDPEAQPGVFRGLARGLLADVTMEDLGEADEIAEAEPPAAAEPAVEKTVRVAARKAVATTSTPSTAPVSTRRTTRSSRLPPPTPVKKMTGGKKKAAAVEKAAAPPAAASAPTLRTRAKSLPKPTPAPSVAPAGSASTSTRSGMATRRTRIAKLGMSGNGTPAPKRRGRAAA